MFLKLIRVGLFLSSCRHFFLWLFELAQVDRLCLGYSWLWSAMGSGSGKSELFSSLVTKVTCHHSITLLFKVVTGLRRIVSELRHLFFSNSHGLELLHDSVSS